MRKEDTIRLNTHFLVRRMEVLELKQWWLADALGVSPKTVNRWLAGKVERIARHNAQGLAEHLGCSMEEITLADEADVHATREQQRVAAGLIQERDLIALLSPSDNWELAESLIKATMQPHLPLRQLGMLYNFLSIATWRQGHYDEGRLHAARAREIGERCGDRGIVHKAIVNIATIDSLVGHPAAALAGFEEALRTPEYFATRRDHAVALSNISMVYRDFARFPESLEAQRECIRIFGAPELPLNLAIAWTSMAQILTELGKLDDALDAAIAARRFSLGAAYERGEKTALLYEADARSLRGEHAEAVRLADKGMTGLARFEVHDLGCHIIAVRVSRRAGKLEAAAGRLEIGLERSRPFPVTLAMLLQEGARLAAGHGDRRKEEEMMAEANGIFHGMGLEMRMHAGPVREYGKMFSIDD